MSFPQPTSPVAPPVFDHAWLARVRRVEIDSADGISRYRLLDVDTGRYWLARVARLAASAGCAQLRNEARLATQLSPAWAAVPVATVWTPDDMAVIFPADAATLPASQWLSTPPAIDVFLDLAIAAARALAETHALGLLHGDLRPHNLLIDEAGRLRLAGFGYATVAPALPRPGAAALPYLAPELARAEQRGADARSDLYALGISLYQLLCGRLPYSAAVTAASITAENQAATLLSPSAWHHAHVAIEPRPPGVHRPEMPPMLGRILLKLMAKDAGERYPSAAALGADLARCRSQWLAQGAIAEFAPAGTASALEGPGTGEPGFATPAFPFALPGRLFGRGRETALLADALARVAECGAAELVLIAGEAGAGKSALAGWLARQAERNGGRIAAGKSEQLQRDIPYAPVAQIVRMLTRDLLGEDEAVVAAVRQRWLEGLAGQGRAIVDLVAEAAHVLGDTSPLPAVPARQAQQRLENAILQTFAALAMPGAPLLLFIDDLQWADAPTLALLERYAEQPPTGVLLVGAYRQGAYGEEVGQDDPAAASPAAALLRMARPPALAVTRVQLQPLQAGDLAELVAATLAEPPQRVHALAQELYRKTGGNPFFSTQLLRTLVDEGVLRREGGPERAAGGWRWDEAEVAQRGYTDNVIELMIRRFARLPPVGATLLQDLACVGIRCAEGLLAEIAALDVPRLRQQLQPYVDAGLLLREAGGYAFQHDRVLEGAYSLVDAAARPQAHARIAGIMIGYWRQDVAAHAFEICSQIERGAGQPLTLAQRVAFVDALVVGGRQARGAAAIGQATRYTELAVALMDAGWWRAHYPLAYAVELLRCECLLSQADLAGAARAIDALLARALPVQDRAAVHRLKAVLQTVRSDYEGAIDAALGGLALLGVHLRRGPDDAHLRAAYDAVTAARGGRAIASLGELPEAGERQVHIVMGLLATLMSSLFVTDGISFLHVAKMVELTLEHGTTPESPYGLSWFGVFIASRYDEYEDGLAYGLAAMALIDRHGYEAERIATLVAVDQVSPWTQPLAYALGHVQRAAAQGLASGDIGMACYARNHIASDLLAMGEQLRLVEEEIERGLELTRLIQYRDIELILNSQKHFVRRLRSGDASAQADGMGEAAERLARSNSQPTRFWIRLYDGMAGVFRGEWDVAARSLTQARALAWSAPAHINVADCHLYLALAAARADAGGADEALGEAHRRLTRWAALNPPNFRGKLLLVEAEMARRGGEVLAALRGYEQAAHAAAAAGFVHELALAHELAGLLCESSGLHTAGLQHQRSAHAAYRRWGADHKAALLEAAHPDLSPPPPAAPALAESGMNGASGGAGLALGMRAARAMSGEMVMDRLIETLMGDILVHAGAQYGLLLLMREDKAVIEASGRVVGERVAVALGASAPTEDALPLAVLNSVLRTRERLVLADAMVDAPSIRGRGRLRSLLCLPLLRGGRLVGIVYLENNLAADVFDAHRVAQLEILAPQVAISLETARLYEQLIEENDRRLAAEMSLRGARAELARSANLTVMGSLAASIAHEVNQPLTAIVASVDASLRWLNRATPDIGEALAGLTHIKQNGLRAADIIRALRALAKQAPAVLAPLAPDEVVREVLGMLRLELEARGLRVHTRLEAGDALIEADRVQLQQVMLNLLTNALDAMAALPPQARELVVASALAPEGIVVSVRDSGGGIAGEVLARIFDPFFTTKSGGMGMGLAICRSIIEAHGGTLEARNLAGGCEFAFRLPVLPAVA